MLTYLYNYRGKPQILDIDNLAASGTEQIQPHKQCIEQVLRHDLFIYYELDQDIIQLSELMTI